MGGKRLPKDITPEQRRAHTLAGKRAWQRRKRLARGLPVYAKVGRPRAAVVGQMRIRERKDIARLKAPPIARLKAPPTTITGILGARERRDTALALGPEQALRRIMLRDAREFRRRVHHKPEDDADLAA